MGKNECVVGLYAVEEGHFIPAAYYLDPPSRKPTFKDELKCPDEPYCAGYSNDCMFWKSLGCRPKQKEDDPNSIYYAFVLKKFMDDGTLQYGQGGHRLWRESLFEKTGGNPLDLQTLDDMASDSYSLRLKIKKFLEKPANIVPRREWAISCVVRS